MTLTQASASIQGVILTRQARDQLFPGQVERQTATVEFWLATTQGPVRVLFAATPPSFFLHSRDQDVALTLFRQHQLRGWLRATPLRSFDDEPLIRCCFATLTRRQQAVELLRLHGIESIESDLRHVDSVLMQHDVRFGMQAHGRLVRHPGYCDLFADHIEACAVHTELSVLSIDLECAADGSLYSIAMKTQSQGGARVLMVGQPHNNTPELPIEWLPDERQLLLAFSRWLRQRDPDIVIGWNVVNFDFRLLLQRAKRHQIVADWGRGGTTAIWRESKVAGASGQVVIPGRVVLDGISTLKTATWQFERYSLEHVAHALLGRGKLIDPQVDKQEAITRLYHQEPIELARYNLEDCQLVLDIFAHCQLLDFVCLRAQLTGLELDRYGGSVAAFSNLYIPRLHQKGYAAPNLGRIHGLPSPGGYVMDSRPGLYRNVLVLDFKSLYPSIIRSFLVDPLGLVLGMQEPTQPEDNKTVPGFLGAQFSRAISILPDLIAALWLQRDVAKQQQDSARSQALKILMNSFYGVLGSTGCRFFDPRLASSITLRGQWLMQESGQWIEQQGWQLIYGDTDSLFVWLGEGVTESQAIEIGQALASGVTAWWQQRLSAEFGLTSCLELQFERYYQRFLMPTIRGTEQGSKKRYAGLSHCEGKEQLIFKGLETVRSDWTELAKHFQQGLYWRIFHDEDPDEFIRETIRQTRHGEVDHWLVYHKRLRRQLDEYQKNVPPHVRAARLADEAEKDKYRLFATHRHRIDYVMTTHGAEPVAYRQHQIDYEHYIEKQLRPVAEAILPFIGRRFDEWANEQLALF